MPRIGLGTFGSDRFGPARVAAAVASALRIGYRLVDCAACYGNEDAIGRVLGEAIAGGLPREQLFIVSKVWNDSHAPDAVVASARRSAADLRVDYLDAYLVHWPFPNTHEPFAPPGARNPASRPYVHQEFMATWRAMESLVDAGIVRHIGVSNVTIPKLELILRDARIAPAINEMELHPCFQQPELFRYCVDRGLAVVAYCPIGSPARPERDRAPEDRADTEHPVVARIARAHGVHPAEVCLKWAAQRGQVPIPFSLDPAHQAANLRAVESDPLTAAEMEDMKAVDCGNRLIKGQVFLWEGSSDWRDLWDVDGTIPAWGDAARRAAPPA